MQKFPFPNFQLFQNVDMQTYHAQKIVDSMVDKRKPHRPTLLIGIYGSIMVSCPVRQGFAFAFAYSGNGTAMTCPLSLQQPKSWTNGCAPAPKGVPPSFPQVRRLLTGALDN